MNFDIADRGRNRHMIFISTAELRMCVAELSFERGAWCLNYNPNSAWLRQHTREVLRAFADEQIILLKIKERLLR